LHILSSASWWTRYCYGRGNSSLHAASAIRRLIARDGWQQHRKLSDLEYCDGKT